MKAWKKIGMLLLVTALLLAHAPCASAEADLDDARFAHKTWQEVIEDFLDEHGANPAKVACGWCNTVTGEEQYFNGDQYMTSGSMYKVPMNMIFAEKVHNGEISWDSFVGGYRYEYALHATIVDSNNDVARGMWEYLGGYQDKPKKVYTAGNSWPPTWARTRTPWTRSFTRTISPRRGRTSMP